MANRDMKDATTMSETHATPDATDTSDRRSFIKGVVMASSAAAAGGLAASPAQARKQEDICERAEIAQEVIFRLRELLREVPAEVIGYQESLAVCCRNGTVALVRMDLDVTR